LLSSSDFDSIAGLTGAVVVQDPIDGFLDDDCHFPADVTPAVKDMATT
jgi:hypothetical protein